MKDKGVHVEVTFLIIPETNDAEDETRRMARFIVDELGPDTPLHLSRFFPQHKFNHVPPTPVETLVKARDIAFEEGVRYVFVGNVPLTDYDHTFCPSCGKAVIGREGYTVTGWHLDEGNNCEYCGSHIAISGKREEHRSSFL